MTLSLVLFVQQPHALASLGALDENITDNVLICSDQFLSLVQGVGKGGGDASAEFRVLMSLKCMKKAKSGLQFGQNTPDQGAPVDVEAAIDLLKTSYRRTTDAGIQTKIRGLIKQLRAMEPESMKTVELRSSSTSR